MKVFKYCQLFVILQILFYSSLRGQIEVPIDKKIIKFNQLLARGSDSEAMTTGAEIAHILLQNGNFAAALTYYDQIADLAEAQQEKGLLLTALTAKSGILRQQKAYRRLSELYPKLIQLSEDNPSPILLLAECYLHLEKPDSALLYLQQLVPKFQDLITPAQSIRARNAFAQVYAALAYPERAEMYLRKNLDHATSVKDTLQMIKALHKLSVFQLEQDQPAKAYRSAKTGTKYAQQAGLMMLEIDLLKLLAEIEKERDAFAKALQIYDRIHAFYHVKKQTRELAKLNESIAELQLHRGNPERALHHFQLALESFKDRNDRPAIIDCQLNIAQIHLAAGRLDQAIDLLESCKEPAEKTSPPQTLRLIYDQLRRAYAKNGNFRAALINYQKQTEIQDTILQLTQQKMIRELETKFDFEKTEKDILELENLSHDKTSRLKQQRGFIFTLGIFLCFLLCLALFYYRNWSKGGIILSQQDEINLRKIQELEKGKKVLSLKSMIEGQERERKRIAGDLHDGLGGLLATVKLQFDTLNRDSFCPSQKNTYLEGKALLDTACAEVRKVAHHMMPSTIDKFGLPAAIEDLCKAFAANRQIEVDFQAINWTEELPENRSIALYRIIQETLQETIRPTSADEVIVQLARHEDTIYLTVEDNDKFPAFSATEIRNNPRYQSIITRLDYLNGNLETDLSPGHGKTLTFILPVG